MQSHILSRGRRKADTFHQPSTKHSNPCLSCWLQRVYVANYCFPANQISVSLHSCCVTVKTRRTSKTWTVISYLCPHLPKSLLQLCTRANTNISSARYLLHSLSRSSLVATKVSGFRRWPSPSSLCCPTAHPISLAQLYPVVEPGAQHAPSPSP